MKIYYVVVDGQDGSASTFFFNNKEVCDLFCDFAEKNDDYILDDGQFEGEIVSGKAIMTEADVLERYEE